MANADYVINFCSDDAYGNLIFRIAGPTISFSHKDKRCYGFRSSSTIQINQTEALLNLILNAVVNFGVISL